MRNKTLPPLQGWLRFWNWWLPLTSQQHANNFYMTKEWIKSMRCHCLLKRPPWRWTRCCSVRGTEHLGTSPCWKISGVAVVTATPLPPLSLSNFPPPFRNVSTVTVTTGPSSWTVHFSGAEWNACLAAAVIRRAHHSYAESHRASCVFLPHPSSSAHLNPFLPLINREDAYGKACTAPASVDEACFHFRNMKK